MSKSLIVPVLTILSLLAFNRGFTQVPSDGSTPSAPSYQYEKPEIEGTTIDAESGNTIETGTIEQKNEEGNVYRQRRENLRPIINTEGNKPTTDNDGDASKYVNYGNGNVQNEKQKNDNGLHKGWYKKGKHKGRQ